VVSRGACYIPITASPSSAALAEPSPTSASACAVGSGRHSHHPFPGVLYLLRPSPSTRLLRRRDGRPLVSRLRPSASKTAAGSACSRADLRPELLKLRLAPRHCCRGHRHRNRRCRRWEGSVRAAKSPQPLQTCGIHRIAPAKTEPYLAEARRGAQRRHNGLEGSPSAQPVATGASPWPGALSSGALNSTPL